MMLVPSRVWVTMGLFICTADILKKYFVYFGLLLLLLLAMAQNWYRHLFDSLFVPSCLLRLSSLPDGH